MNREPMENFLQALFRLQENGAPVGVSAIARKLGVTPAAVTQMGARLADEGWLRRRGRAGLELLPKGRTAAVRLLRRHRLAERFFTDLLGLSLEQSHEEAHRFEHVLSDEVEKRLDALLGHPERCPCGDPIPSESGEIRADRDLVPLASLAPGQKAVIVRVSEEDARILRYIEALRLLPGTHVTVTEQAPFQGPVGVRAGESTRMLGREVASRIFVRRNGRPPRSANGRVR